MPPIRVGDTWTFDATPQDFLPGDGAVENLGAIPSPESYHIIMTGRVRWQDPDGAQVPRTLALDLTIDGYDANGALVDWESGLHFQVNRNYDTVDSAIYEEPCVTQSTAELPAAVETLRLQVLDQSGGPAPQYTPQLLELRVVATLVTPQ